MIGTQIKIKNHDTGQEIILNDHSDPANVIALQSFPTFETDVRAQNLPRLGAHGEVRLPTYYSGMSIVLQGVIACDNEASVWALKRQFDTVMRLSRTGFAKVVESENVTPAFAVNECTNPTGQIDTTGWTPQNTTIAISGEESIEVTTTSSGNAGVQMIVTDDDYSKDAGDVYDASVLIKNDEETDRTYRITIQARNSVGGSLGSTNASLLIAGGATARLKVSHTLPANTADIVVTIIRQNISSVNGDIYHISKVLIAKNLPSTIDPETDYFDGNTPDLTFLKYVWSGQEGLSASEVYKQTFPSMFRNTVRLSFTNPEGKKVFVDATPIKAVSYDRPILQNFLLNFQVILRSNFPVLLIDSDEPQIAIGDLGSSKTGFKLPTNLPLSLGTDYVQGGLTINMETAGFAVVRLYGSDQGTLINPKITNLTNGNSVKILRPLLGSDRYFAIDGVYQTMKDENGQSVIQYSDGDYIYLEAGENILLYSADNMIPN